MSHYSGYSSASRLELAKKDKEMTAMATQMANMQAILEANGLIPALAPVEKMSVEKTVDQTVDQSVRGQPRAQTGACSQQAKAQGINLTPSRKRHSSQQLERVAKIAGGANRNRFEILNQADSYPDRSMKPGSVISTPGTSLHVASYASKLGGSGKPVGRPANQTSSFSSSHKNRAQDQTQARAQAQAEAGSQTQTQSADTMTNQTDHQGVGQNHGLVEGLFEVQNKGAMRQEIEIALESLNGEPFRGTITPLEAKYGIYARCLGFPDFDNFEGYRFGHKGVPVITLILKSAINVDELLPVQFFDFHRKSSRQGRSHTDIISCKIRGLRSQPSQYQTSGLQGKSANQQDDGTRTISIEGCEYRVPKEALIQFLSSYGEVTSDILEVVFKDGNNQNNIRMGSYSVTVKLNRDLPQLAPIMGKRVKFFYKGIQKLCPKCFGPHHIKNCHSQKVQWIKYVKRFIDSETEIPRECFGRWIEILRDANSPIRRSHTHRSPSYDQRSFDMDVTTEVEREKEKDPGNQGLPSSSISQISDTASWIKNLPPQNKAVRTDPDSTLVSGSHGKNESSQTSNAAEADKPQEKDFHLPSSKEEHKVMVEKLVKAGSLPTEAEQIICNRRTAFNKACREYKKLLPVKQSKMSQRKLNKTSKTASLNANNYAN